MPPRRKPLISARKAPKQARANELVSAVLQAAVQVLEREGAARFTTARVADKAGVSVGSLYQYFPNKAAILFRLQSDEWQQTSDLLRSILDDRNKPPLERLRALVHAFVRSECAEAKVRIALSDAAPLYRDAPEAARAHGSVGNTIQAFMREVLPKTPIEKRALAGDLVKRTLSEVAKSFSEKPRAPEQIGAFADALADMLCAYLVALSAPGKG